MGHYHLTVDLDESAVSPEDWLRAYSAAPRLEPHESWMFEPDTDINDDWWVRERSDDIDIRDEFPWAFMWAGCLHLGLPHDYEKMSPVSDPESENDSYADYLVPVAKTYENWDRALLYYYYSVPTYGRIVVHQVTDGFVTVAEDFKWGDNHGWWRKAKDPDFWWSTGSEGAGGGLGLFRGPLDYVQAEYGIHVLNHEEIVDNERRLNDEEIV